LLCPALPSRSDFDITDLVGWPTWSFEIEELQCKNSVCHLAILRGQKGYFSLRIAHRGQHEGARTCEMTCEMTLPLSRLQILLKHVTRLGNRSRGCANWYVL